MGNYNKMTALLARDERLEELEENLQWSETINYCTRLWENEKSCNNLLRLMSQAWILCVEIDQLPPANGNPQFANYNDFDKWLGIIVGALEFGDRNYYENITYHCLSGLMMTMMDRT